MIYIITALLVIFFGYHFYWKRRNFPPGPLPLPLIGNLHTIKKLEPGYDAFIQWGKQYGPVFTYWLGTTPFVTIVDYQLMKETFVKDGDSYVDKFRFEELMKIYRGGFYGILDTNGDFWREHRRFTLHLLRDLGLGKQVMEQRILLEAEAFTEALKSKVGQDLDICPMLDVAVGSVINQLLLGYRFDDERVEEFLYFKSLINDQVKKTNNPITFLMFLFPKLQCLPFLKKSMNMVLEYRDKFFGFFARQIEEHEKHVDYDSEESSDYVDAYLKEKRKREQEGDFETFSMIQLQNMCFDLWIAGLETTSNTLTWGIVYILNYPEVQDKMHAELSRVIGSSRLITISDRTELPYINAAICEIQRVTNLLPQNLAHLTTRDVVINGYPVKKGTAVVAQMSSVLYDEKIFPEPYSFKPERFIDENGKLKKVEEFIPFSIGKRQCPGEGLAKMELFLFIANMFNRFKLHSSGAPPSMKKQFGNAVHPEDFTCKWEKRL